MSNKIEKAVYQYIKRGRLYVCVQQNIISLVWKILVRNRALGLPAIGVTRSKGMNLIKSLIRHRLNMNSGSTVIELPIQGNLALDVHQGSKIFMFNEMKVAKVIAPEMSASALAQEMDSVRTAGKLETAPTIYQYDYEGRWYIEDYVPGEFLYIAHKSSSEKIYKTYEKEIIECLITMTLAQPLIRVTLKAYVQKLVTNILEEKLSRLNLNQQGQTTIQEFIRSVESELQRHANQEIDLIFSHGDFSLQNILKTRGKLKVIDWEGVQSRSILYDFYNFFMTELYYERSETDLVTEIDTAQSKLQSQLAMQEISRIKNIKLSDPLYLRLFFLERILMLLERDSTERNLNVLMRSIEIFSGYESNAAKCKNW